MISSLEEAQILARAFQILYGKKAGAVAIDLTKDRPEQLVLQLVVGILTNPQRMDHPLHSLAARQSAA